MNKISIYHFFASFTTAYIFLRNVYQMPSEAGGLVTRPGYSMQGSQASNHLGKSLTKAGNLTGPPRLIYINRGGHPNAIVSVNH
jgi:hypothetical protein